ncbi:hypothetical protein N8766_03915 [bacterium]|nr:hypothetical protein [bacterium]
MTVTIPPEVLKSNLSLSAKLIVGAVLSHPTKKKKQIAAALGVRRNQIFQALKQAREKGIDIDTFSTDIDTKRTDIDTLPKVALKERIDIDTKRTDIDTPHPIDSKIEGKETENKLGSQATESSKPSKIPTLEEVTAYATRYQRADLAMPFFDQNEERDWKGSDGSPVRSWQALLRWQVQNKPKVAVKWNPKEEPYEEVLLRMDMANN